MLSIYYVTALTIPATQYPYFVNEKTKVQRS